MRIAERRGVRRGVRHRGVEEIGADVEADDRESPSLFETHRGLRGGRSRTRSVDERMGLGAGEQTREGREVGAAREVSVGMERRVGCTSDPERHARGRCTDREERCIGFGAKTDGFGIRTERVESRRGAGPKAFVGSFREARAARADLARDVCLPLGEPQIDPCDRCRHRDVETRNLDIVSGRAVERTGHRFGCSALPEQRHRDEERGVEVRARDRAADRDRRIREHSGNGHIGVRDGGACRCDEPIGSLLVREPERAAQGQRRCAGRNVFGLSILRARLARGADRRADRGKQGDEKSRCVLRVAHRYGGCTEPT